jgi:hypothetical protein
MNDNRVLAWVWKAIEAAALGAVVLLLYQTRQQTAAVEERVRKLDARLAESATSSQRTTSPAVLQVAGVAGLGDQEALAQRIVSLLRSNGFPEATTAPGEPAAEPEEARPTSPEAESRVRQAERIVSQALSQGRLEREAVIKMRELQSQSGNDPRFVAMRNEIIGAINQQKLVPEDVAFVAF